MEAIELMMQQPWAMEEGHLRAIARIARRHQKGERADLEAISREIGKPLENARTVSYKRGVASIPLSGSIFPKANLMTEVSGATSMEMFMQDFEAALVDPSVRAILLSVDSPGGAVTGIHDAGEMIYQTYRDGTKPIATYCSGLCCSAAYWAGSASGMMIASPTASVGSIGVVATLQPKDDGSGEIEIVSSNASKKRLDPASEEGRSAWQERVDAIENVFIGSVARNRNVSVQDVIENFGQGGVLTGIAAANAGMIDAVMTEDQAIELLRMMAK